jgi:hypothetical protein
VGKARLHGTSNQSAEYGTANGASQGTETGSPSGTDRGASRRSSCGAYEDPVADFSPLLLR